MSDGPHGSPTPAPSSQVLSERYRILHEIGRGGMATVYLAEDLKHRRQVAVKVMQRSGEDGIDRHRFLREIEVAARLSHPHIVPLFDSGAAGDDLYYVMPYVAGETLRVRLAREGPLPIEQALRFGHEIASALGHAHGHGLIHRDLKPENILLADGIPLVADFGIARAVAVAADDGTRASTAVGALVGTPTYMSPEQACGDHLDQRSDVYSLGCVVFEMLAGRPPFLASSAHAVVRQHLTDPAPPVESIRREMPIAVSHVIARALAKHPDDRPATALQFAEALVAAAASVPTPQPPAVPEQTRPHNLPEDRTRFIGRDRELAACTRSIRETRLLTLTGIGGSGKTRLALKVAEQLLPTVPGGAWFVDLAPTRDYDQLLNALVSTLGVRESPDRDLARAITHHLTGTQTLLLLDNCEQVLEAARRAVDVLLQVRGVCVLATSREALGVEGEQVFAVADLEASDAVKLFVDSARRVVADFELTAANAAVTAAICRGLDGIPLAIELAAARVKVLSVAQIRDRLSDALQLLTTGTKTPLGRHQTLEATIAWSYDQLTAEEQRLLRMLAVFSGGWSFESLCRVSDTRDQFLLLDDLSRLVDKSLVLVHRRPSLEPRYNLLETVRQFAARRLAAAGELQSTRARHAEEFSSMAERAFSARLDDEDRWLSALSAEHDNLRTALEFHRTTDAERHLQMAGALAWFWMARSHLFEGRDHVTAALESTDARPVRPARARALAGVAAVHVWLGDAASASGAWRESLSDWREIGDGFEIAMTLEGIGWSHFMVGDDEEAYATFKEMMELRQVKENAHLLNRANLGVGQLAVALGRTDEARACAREILRQVERYPNSRSEHLAYHYLADCALLGEQFDESLTLYRRSLELAIVLGDRIEIGLEIQGVAMSLVGLGTPAEAMPLVHAVEAEWARLGATVRVRFWSALLDRYISPARRQARDAPSPAMPFDAAVQLALTLAAPAA